MSRKRKPKYIRIFVLTLFIVFLANGAYKTVSNFLPFILSRPFRGISSPLRGPQSQDSSPAGIKEPISLNSIKEELYSPYAILIRLKDNKVAFRTRSEERIYPASLTKIMTAIIAMENISDLKESVILPENIFPSLYAANASMAGFLPGEKVTVIDLLYGTLLPSGADASMGLALRVSGSEDEFVKLMNKKAKQLGMNDTHFTNVCGLYDDNHYTTVKDISVLLEYALKNKTFREVFTSARHSTAGTNMHPDGITYYSTMFEKMDTYEFDGGRILGGKTGYTRESGLCLASLAEKNGNEYILITAGAPGDHLTKQYHIMDAFMVYGKYLKK
ncbi:hypothetical protein SDC9_112539 [bioreactor metagenome]|uniref:Peptidase S11 D-alanyl-D-alanine carboxypeptidase A N-terminal domain-containing protein n=1 Tax=bioreactor metagenome TaxID=1076179 RepID=A0A645BK93_9ZZZZ